MRNAEDKNYAEDIGSMRKISSKCGRVGRSELCTFSSGYRESDQASSYCVARDKTGPMFWRITGKLPTFVTFSMFDICFVAKT